jgi:hypothetical protein
MNDNINQLLEAWKKARIEANNAFREFKAASPEKESELLSAYIDLDAVEQRAIDALVEAAAEIPLSDLPPDQLNFIMREIEESLKEENNRRNRHH